jgi:hypothetical protein
MATTLTPPNPQVQQEAKRAYTTPAEHNRYLVMVDNAREYVLKENSPRDVVYKVIQVVPNLENVSFDRGESYDRFYVVSFSKDANGKLTPMSDPTDPAAGAFFEGCKEFIEKYKVAV